MVPVNYVYACFSAGPHQRQPRNAGGGLVNLAAPTQGSLSSGDMLPQVYAPDPWPGTTYRFCLWNVSGGSLSPGGPPVGVTGYDLLSPEGVVVGDAPIAALALYVPISSSGNGGGPSGATIDELDISTNQLISDTFVTVAPDPSGALTESANVEGFVDTTNGDEDITALAVTSPTGVDFVGWAVLGSPTTFSPSPTLKAARGSSVSALALYQTPPDNVATISGKITYDSDGGIYPLGALVEASPGGTTQASGGDGSYVLGNLQPGTVEVRVLLTAAAKRFFVPPNPEATVTVVAGQTTTLDFRLVRVGTKF